ncbi:MAG: undecaprenyldiphospho-muramoylpentapeptide beta-N-acetylglucosaminyltransferase [Bacteroidales bacterium]
MEKTNTFRLIISGGGTGGHIFPAIAIAGAVKQKMPDANILFVGAKGRMEMEKVPAAGYEIKGLDIVGLQRKQWWRNFAFPFKLIASLWETRKILKHFRPDVVVGVGGYASGPTLFMAHWMKIPTLLQEQNSYPGLTNRLLARGATKICVDYDNMASFFAAQKIVWTGNPIRQDIVNVSGKYEEAIRFFEFDKDKKVILVMGGSLGARTINQSMAKNIDALLNEGYQVIWQTGKSYYSQALALTQGKANIRVFDFIARMDLAYAITTIIVSRAGAIAISELCVIGKPSILIPSPNVAEDHQTKNAMALSAKNAAILLPDHLAEEQLGDLLLQLMKDENRQRLLSENIIRMAKINAAEDIAEEVIKLKIK